METDVRLNGETAPLDKRVLVVQHCRMLVTPAGVTCRSKRFCWLL